MLFRHLLFRITIAATALAVISCQEDTYVPPPAFNNNNNNNDGGNTQPEQPEVPDQPQEYDFAANPASLSFPGEGGDATFELSTNCAWTSRCDADWITYGHTFGQGDDIVYVSVTANPSTEESRSAEILFYPEDGSSGSLRFAVTQEPNSNAGSSVIVNVTTGDASQISTTGATLQGSYAGNADSIYDRGFYYGVSSSNLNLEAGLNSTTGASGSFSATVSSLEPGTTYYYKAYVTVWNASENKYVDFTGSVKSFTTTSSGTTSSGLQYLGCYEMPAISLSSSSGYSGKGKESDCNTNWYNYNTTNSNQIVVTHTFPYGGKTYRNYTILVDKTKKAALWNAFVMHKDVFAKDNNVGRSGSWHQDPAVPSSWQSCFSSSGFSRGHEVASNYRQVCTEANKQTFYYTNQALQYQTSFNDGVWNSLENAVVSSSPSGRDTLYVVVGLLYENNKQLDGVPVPSHFYKCLMKCSFDSSGNMTGAKGAAYIFTNEAHSGMSYSQGATSIDAIEQRAGFDFFANVPKQYQDAAEKTTSGVL